MKRLVCSLFAVAFAVSFGACEGHSVAELPEHYQHKIHGEHHEGAEHPEGEKHAAGDKHIEAQKGHEAAPAHPEAKPAEAAHK
jgi:hypothetical protein